MWSRRKSRRNNLLAYALVLPTVLVIGALVLYPVLTTLVQSFYHEGTFVVVPGFAGLHNYTAILGDQSFTRSVQNSFLYVIVGTVLLVGGGLASALVLKRGFRGRAVVLAILVLPWALPAIVEGLIWSWLYDPTYGVVDAALVKLGVIAHPLLLIGHDRYLSIVLIELVQVWQLLPLTTLMILASMQGIPDELYQASSIDGAGPVRQFLRITLPLVRPGLTIAIVESVVSVATMFDVSFALTGGTGADETNPVMAEIYNQAFVNQNFGRSYAGVFLVTGTLMALSALVIKLLYRSTEY